MIRQFGFTWTAISWLLMGYGLFFALSPLQAQTAIKKFSLELKNESLPEALKQLEKAGGKNILFTYNGTESYRVTVSIREKTEREAIDLVLAGKPFLCIEREEYFVVQRKKSDKAIAIAGKVYDEKGAPLPFVNILALAADSSFLAGSVTEEDGSFHLPPVAGEDCLLKATYIGYRPQIIPCRQQNTIRLQPDTELLKEVVITASRPLIERKDGTLTANIAGTPLSLMGSAKEMISHLPFVTGSDGEFTVLGRGTPEIYINGRKVRDKTELDRLQANEILSAEIITTPGVQYGSSVGAVIRLRTIRKRGQGMSGSFYTDYSQGREPIGNEGISLNYRTGGLDIFVKGDFAEINNYRTGTSSQDIYASSNWNQSTEDKSKQTYRTFNGELGFNYEIDEDQSFGMRYMPGTNIGNAHTTNEGTTLILQDGKEVDHLHALRQTDAHTGLVGKWHIQSQPQGFDYYSIFYDQGEYRDPTFIESTDPWPGNRRFGERVLGFSTDLVTEKAIRWMKEQDGNQPFLMCCHFKATHEPYDYPIRMEHLYDGVTFPEPENLLDWGPETNGRSFKGQTLEELERRWRIASQDPDKWWCRYPGLPFSTEGMQRTAARRASYQKFIRDYLRCGATVDDNIGKLLKALDEMNIADNTIVIYVSDQGYFLGEHGFFDKRMFYEESARMPFVIRYPKKVPAGKRLDDLILNVDFAPTLAEFAGVKMENVQGDSFVSNLEGNTPTDWRKEIYYRYWTNHAIRPAHFAIRSDRYKLIFYYARNLDMTDTENFDFTPSWDFYDLQNDPHENHNAYNDPKYAPVIKQMKKDLLRLRKETGDTDGKYPEMQELLEKYYNK